jgi:hypothetical protein
VGGEVFIHPELKDILQVISRYRNRFIELQIITNATVTPSTAIFDMLKENNIRVVISDYRKGVPSIVPKVDKFIEQCNKAEVSLIIASIDNWCDYAIGKTDTRFHNENNIVRHFDHCDYPCRYLRDGKLYYCTSDAMAKQSGIIGSVSEDFFELKSNPGVDDKLRLLEFDYGIINEKGYAASCQSCYGGWSINKHLIPVAEQAKGDDYDIL